MRKHNRRARPANGHATTNAPPTTTHPTAASQVLRLAEASLPTRFGAFRVAVFRVPGAPTEPLALIRGDVGGEAPTLVRVHSECLTGEVLGSLRCDCGEQLAAAMSAIAEAGRGVLLYLRQEGRGIGLVNKIRAYALQDGGLDTVDANLALGLPIDGRDYASAAAVLRHLGVRQVRLLTNNPAKLAALERHGVQVVERVPLEVPPNPVNLPYLRAKATRLGHLLVHGGLDGEPWPGSAQAQSLRLEYVDDAELSLEGEGNGTP